MRIVRCETTTITRTTPYGPRLIVVVERLCEERRHLVVLRLQRRRAPSILRELLGDRLELRVELAGGRLQLPSSAAAPPVPDAGRDREGQRSRPDRRPDRSDRRTTGRA